MPELNEVLRFRYMNLFDGNKYLDTGYGGRDDDLYHAQILSIVINRWMPLLKSVEKRSRPQAYPAKL